MDWVVVLGVLVLIFAGVAVTAICLSAAGDHMDGSWRWGHRDDLDTIVEDSKEDT